jgi:hypothetical protein
VETIEHGRPGQRLKVGALRVRACACA